MPRNIWNQGPSLSSLERVNPQCRSYLLLFVARAVSTTRSGSLRYPVWLILTKKVDFTRIHLGLRYRTWMLSLGPHDKPSIYIGMLRHGVLITSKVQLTSLQPEAAPINADGAVIRCMGRRIDAVIQLR